jgi:SAM-dependent methyltransferase
MLYKDVNEENRQRWLRATLSALPAGWRILDAGAGQLRNKPLCAHLEYLSQDFGQYDGTGDGSGLQTGGWDTSRIDIISDITQVPKPDASFDAILCSEVLEHVPDPIPALKEFARLVRPGGKLIMTVPFASMVHFAPYHFSSGFSRFWHEHHLPRAGFEIEELTPNGDWFSFMGQEMLRLGVMARRKGDWAWPLGYMVGAAGWLYLKVARPRPSPELACFGWHCVAKRT